MICLGYSCYLYQAQATLKHDSLIECPPVHNHVQAKLNIEIDEGITILLFFNGASTAHWLLVKKDAMLAKLTSGICG